MSIYYWLLVAVLCLMQIWFGFKIGDLKSDIKMSYKITKAEIERLGAEIVNQDQRHWIRSSKIEGDLEFIKKEILQCLKQ
jgi:hypothetical protein